MSAYLRRLGFGSRVYARVFRRRQMICMGDSHVSVFKYIGANGLIKGYDFDVVDVGGATAQGLINPNSKTDALKIFSERIARARKDQTLLFQMGEVDCGFVIWYYAEKFSVSIEEQMERSIGNYTSFLEKNRSDGFKNIIVLSAPLPTIKDGQDWGDVANARREVKASQKQRTALTVEYNKKLGEMCDSRGIPFIDTTDFLLDRETGIIKKEFLNTNVLDHHLDDKAYAELLCGLIGKNSEYGLT